MYKTGKSKMQVNMYRAVFILLLVVSWVQSQSTTSSLSPVATSNAVPTKQSSSASSTKTTIAALAGTTNLTTPVAISTTPTSSKKTTIAASAGTTNLTTTVAISTTPTSSKKTTIAASAGTTYLTTPVATSTTPTSSTKTTIAASAGTTNLTTTVATSTTPTSSTKTTIAASAGTTNLTTTVTTSTTPTSSTKTTIAASAGTTNLTTTVATSTTPTSNPDTTATTTGTTHTIGLSTTGTATNGNPKLTTELKTGTRTQSPGTTKTTTPATSTVRVTSLGKIYISEVMVGRDGVLPWVELFVTAEVNISHYTLAVFDTQNTVQSYQLNHQPLHDGFLTVSLNNTMLGFKTNSVGIALYDANLWIKKTLDNTAGLVDALVIGTSFQTTSARLVQVLTPGCLPIVLQLNQISENKSITRCSEERACDSSMFIYTSASFGKNNSAICENRWKNMDIITLKFNCSCQACDNTRINEIIHFLIQEIDKNCQCEVTALNIIDSYIACCGGTALHATIVAADSEQRDKMMKAYETLLHSTTTVTLGHNNYTINKECGSFCCHQTVHSTDSSKSSTDSSKSSTDSSKTELKTEANIKLRVAVTVTCIMVFLVIVIFVVMYRRRKKRGVHQFSMIRLNEEDEDLIMDRVQDDNVVGGQEATFYKNRLGS